MVTYLISLRRGSSCEFDFKIKSVFKVYTILGVCQSYLHLVSRICCASRSNIVNVAIMVSSDTFNCILNLTKKFKNCNIYNYVLKNNSLYTNIKPYCWVLGWLFAFSTRVLISLLCNFLLPSLICNIISTKCTVDLIDFCMNCEHIILLFYIC